MIQDIADLLFHDKVQKRQKWIRLFDNEIWRPIFQAPLSAHRDLAYKQLKNVADSGLVSVLNFIDDPTNIFTAHEMIGMVSGSTTTKFTVHYNLFGGSIVALHTQRHKSIFEKLDRLEITGCFCLTELGYGNNAVEMQTTATYDEKSKEFIVNSPTTLSQKYWITNGAVHANMALVFAQTIVKEKNQGINAFLVPIRDKNLKQLQGVEIRQMGLKIGLNGVDNAALLFHNVRIPRVNMMNKYCDVTENGQFKSDIKGIQQRFFKVTQRLLSGRLCIASMTLGALKRMIYTTVKYSKQRYGVSPNGKSQTPIFEYQLQKNALIPIISRMLGLNMLHNFAKEAFAQQRGYQQDLLMICCVDKTLVGWHSERSIAIMRERCGGQGFLAANTFGQGMAGSHAALTAEGDNRVLMIKVVKDMLTIFSKNPESYYNGQYKKFVNLNELANLNQLVTLFEMRHKNLLIKLVTKMTDLKSKGASNYDILMFNVSDQIQSLAQAYGEMLAMRHCLKSLQRLNKSKEVMKNYFILFAWEILLRDMSSLLLDEWICPVLAKQLPEEYNNLIKKAADHVDNIIESMNIPVRAVYAPIAKNYVLYNEKSYEGEVINAKM